MTARAALLAVLLLAGCGQNDNDPGPGGVTVGEARALDEAAEMLEQQRLPEGALGSVDETGDGETGDSETGDRETGVEEAAPAPSPSPAA